jgi:rSAM/selenodomain-associated transferase 2
MSSILTIIPTLNAASTIEASVQSLIESERAGLNAGWIVSDGGSNDSTVEIAKRAGCSIVTGAQGRGGQLALGAQAAIHANPNADWLLFLHADTHLEPGWTAHVRRFYDAYSNTQTAGFFKFALNDRSVDARRLERFVNWRARTLKLPYGDQGLLISKSFYQALGGFKPSPLFEDVDLIRRIGPRRLQGLNVRAITSAERFLREGYHLRSAKNIWLLTRYFLGEDTQSLAKAYRS